MLPQLSLKETTKTEKVLKDKTLDFRIGGSKKTIYFDDIEQIVFWRQNVENFISLNFLHFAFKKQFILMT